MNRVLITGSRNWVDPAPIVTALDVIYGNIPVGETMTVVHGAARGADEIAGRWARSHPDPDVIEERHPADWNAYGKSAGHRRNAEMVALGACVCLAFPIGESRGTRGCIKAAEAANIPIQILEG